MNITKKLALTAALTGVALTLVACGGSKTDDSTINLKIGVTGGVYEELWAPAQALLKEDGINVEIIQFADYVTPNNALHHGEIDLNGFQHRIYLNAEVNSHGYDIQNIGNTVIIPLNLYSKNIDSLDELKAGDVIAIPDDVTNGARALKVLEAAGLVTLTPGEYNPTVADVLSKSVDFEILELAANLIPANLQDVTAGIINGPFAYDFGLDSSNAVYVDTVLDDTSYWNLIAARKSDLKDPETAAIYKKVVEAYQSTESQANFDSGYGQYFVPVGWDEDLIG